MSEMVASQAHAPADRRQHGTRGRGVALEAHLGEELAAQGAAMSPGSRVGWGKELLKRCSRSSQGVSDKKDCSVSCHGI